MTLLGTIDASAPESRTHLDEEAGGGGNSSLVKWDLYDAVALYMTGAFDRRVQELADSVAQGLQPSIQFVTPEFYVVKSAESIDNTTATFTGTSASRRSPRIPTSPSIPTAASARTHGRSAAPTSG